MSFAVNSKCAECGRWYPREQRHVCASKVAELGVPEDPWEAMGWRDATEGRTSCPVGGPGDPRRTRWERGYDRALEAGLTSLTRFGLRARAA